MDRVSILGQMGKNTMDNGRKMLGMEKESGCFKMVVGEKGHSRMAKKMV